MARMATAPLPARISKPSPSSISRRSTPSITPRRPGRSSSGFPPHNVLASDSEVQIGFDLEHALAETDRCFSCGTCIQCDNCIHYCPDLAVKRDGDGYVVLTDYCKGCGICVKECPTGSMKMLEEAR